MASRKPAGKAAAAARRRVKHARSGKRKPRRKRQPKAGA